MKQCIPPIQYCYKGKEEAKKCPELEKEASSTSSSSSLSEDTIKKPKLDITLTNRGFQLYGTWSETTLRNFLVDSLKQCIKVQLKKIFRDSTNERLWISISSGLYSTSVLKILREKGMSLYTIIKVMKLGLISLSYCELNYFKDFNVDPYILDFNETWSGKFDDRLISNLKPIGFNELECWNIIVYGVKHQPTNILNYLMIGGIDVPGILNWRTVVHPASPEIIQFLKHIGIKKDVVQLVKEYGIDEESEQILIDLGFNEIKEQFLSMKEVICESKISSLESDIRSSEKLESTCKMNDSKSTFSSMNRLSSFQQYTCQCHLFIENRTEAELSAQRRDHLRQIVMVPLAWAMARALKYNPTDPLHYTAYQLLRWTCNNVSEAEKHATHQLIASATIEMDHKLTQKKRLEKEELIRAHNEERLRNTICTDPQIKQRHVKSLKEHEICEFPELCTSCKINT